MMIYCAYYTRGTPYEQESLVLRESLDALQLPHDITAVDRFPTWQQATQYKAVFVEAMLHKHKRRVTYIDVDSVVIHEPHLLDEIDADLAAVVFAGCELLSGVVMFDFTPATLAVVAKWREINREQPESWDQRTLHQAIKATPCRFQELPPTYNFIVGLSQKQYPGKSPTILATRGALRFQKEINRG